MVSTRVMSATVQAATSRSPPITSSKASASSSSPGRMKTFAWLMARTPEDIADATPFHEFPDHADLLLRHERRNVPATGELHQLRIGLDGEHRLRDVVRKHVR